MTSGILSVVPPSGRPLARVKVSGALGGGRHSDVGRVQVLVVDDSTEARQAARRTLERDGFLVEQAPDGAGALEAVAQLAPDLVLLDLAMPGMGGMEALARLRRTSTVPVIVLSGQDDEHVRVAALNMGADDYVVGSAPCCAAPGRSRSKRLSTSALW